MILEITFTFRGDKVGRAVDNNLYLKYNIIVIRLSNYFTKQIRGVTCYNNKNIWIVHCHPRALLSRIFNTIPSTRLNRSGDYLRMKRQQHRSTSQLNRVSEQESKRAIEQWGVRGARVCVSVCVDNSGMFLKDKNALMYNAKK